VNIKMIKFTSKTFRWSSNKIPKASEGVVGESKHINQA